MDGMGMIAPEAGAVEDRCGRPWPEGETDFSRLDSLSARVLAECAVIRDAGAMLSNTLEGTMMEACSLSVRAGETSGCLLSIDRISARPNLLSLNARMSATRAGQHGAGCAVIAQEVKVLAVEAGALSANTESRLRELVAATRGVQAHVGAIVQAVHGATATLTDLLNRQRPLAERIGDGCQPTMDAAGIVAGVNDVITRLQFAISETGEGPVQPTRPLDTLTVPIEGVARNREGLLTATIEPQKALT